MENIIESSAMAIADLLEEFLTANEENNKWAIFIGQEPAVPDNVITLYDQEGRITQAHTRQLWEKPNLQIRVRGLEYEETYTIMMKIATSLILEKPFSTENYRYEGCVFFGSPYFLGVDEKRRYIWSINFTIHRKPLVSQGS